MLLMDNCVTFLGELISKGIILGVFSDHDWENYLPIETISVIRVMLSEKVTYPIP